MEINKKDLKKISFSFRNIASRTIGACHQEFDSILKIFIRHIYEEPLLIDYINTFEVNVGDISKDFQNLSYHSGFNTGSTKEEEIVKTYNILKHMVDNNISVLHVSLSYSSSQKYNDNVKGFADRVVFPFVNYINEYLVGISIDMGYDENESFKITMSGGQVNLAKDNSVINAIQNNNGIDISELNKLILNVRNAASNDTSVNLAEVTECLDAITEEITSTDPKKNTLAIATRGLNVIKGTTEFAAAVTSLITFILPLL